MKKLYAHNEILTTDNPDMIADWNWLRMSAKAITETESNLGTEIVRRTTKLFASRIRDELKLDRILGFFLVDVKEGQPERIAIMAFNVIATNDNFYPATYDKETNRHFIEVSDEEYEAALELGDVNPLTSVDNIVPEDDTKEEPV